MESIHRPVQTEQEIDIKRSTLTARTQLTTWTRCAQDCKPAGATSCAALLLAGLLACSTAPVHAQDAQCQALAPALNENIVLRASGNYCLANDLRIEKGWNLPDAHSSRPDKALVIAADDVVLDLQGHTIDAGNKASGITIPQERKPEPQRVTIRNGTLRAGRSIGVDAGFGSLSIASDREYYGTPQWSGTYERLVRNTLLSRPSGASDYPRRSIRIEHMRIDARDRSPTPEARPGAINIQGAGTVIRDCVIETNAGTAIWIFGPDAVIENNTIIVHGDDPLREADAPIRLHAADGAVIRNNRFIIKGAAHHRGIAVFDTGPVTVDNNTFYGMTEQDDVAKAYTGTLQLKASGNRFEPGWKALFISP